VLFTWGSADAQTNYPTRTVRIVLGFGPGTSPDVAARAFAEGLSQKWGKPVVVENAVGASGNIAGERVARAEPDGHTLLFASSSGIVIGPSLYKKMSYDPVKELKPISILYSHPNILVVHKDVAATTVQELVALARARPGVLNAASAGLGTTQHLNVEMFRQMAQIDVVHVPYSGGTNLMTDLLAGRVDFFFGIPTNVLAQVRDGGVRALAVTSAKRFAGAPELPTMAELGFPAFEMTVWWGLLAPSGTPPALIETLHRATAQILALPDMRKRFDEMNVEPVGNSPADFSAVIAAELPKWAKLVKAGIALD
jgi:tripartite-type tricarboxylate transporter receptor subunit TctC